VVSFVSSFLIISLSGWVWFSFSLMSYTCAWTYSVLVYILFMFSYSVLSWVFTAVVMFAIFSVVTSSMTSILICRLSDVVFRPSAISYRILSTFPMCWRVRNIVLSFAIRWDRFVFTAFAMSWHLDASVHSEAFISSVVVAIVTM
jgi:hypothetical protein